MFPSTQPSSLNWLIILQAAAGPPPFTSAAALLALASLLHKPKNPLQWSRSKIRSKPQQNPLHQPLLSLPAVKLHCAPLGALSPRYRLVLNDSIVFRRGLPLFPRSPGCLCNCPATRSGTPDLVNDLSGFIGGVPPLVSSTAINHPLPLSRVASFLAIFRSISFSSPWIRQGLSGSVLNNG